MRAAHRPEPPNPAADDVGWVRPPREERRPRAARQPLEATSVSEALRGAPGWEGEPPEAPGARDAAPAAEREEPPAAGCDGAAATAVARPTGCLTRLAIGTRREGAPGPRAALQPHLDVSE